MSTFGHWTLTQSLEIFLHRHKLLIINGLGQGDVFWERVHFPENCMGNTDEKLGQGLSSEKQQSFVEKVFLWAFLQPKPFTLLWGFSVGGRKMLLMARLCHAFLKNIDLHLSVDLDRSIPLYISPLSVICLCVYMYMNVCMCVCVYLYSPLHVLKLGPDHRIE